MSTPDQIADMIIEKNIKVFGDINAYVESFLAKTTADLQQMAEGSTKEMTKLGQRKLLERILTKEGLTEENKARIMNEMKSGVFAAAAAGRKKKVTRRAKRRHGKKSRGNLRRVNT